MVVLSTRECAVVALQRCYVASRLPPPSPPLPPSRASRVFNVTFVAREAGPFSQTIDIFTERGNIKVNVTANITVSSKEA